MPQAHRRRPKAPLSAEDIQELYRIIQRGKFHEGKGEYSKRRVNDEYIDYVVSTVKVERPLRVVIDSGNGATGPTAMEVYKRLGCDVTGICLEPDGNFPTTCLPLKESLCDLMLSEASRSRCRYGPGWRR